MPVPGNIHARPGIPEGPVGIPAKKKSAIFIDLPRRFKATAAAMESIRAMPSGNQIVIDPSYPRKVRTTNISVGNLARRRNPTATHVPARTHRVEVVTPDKTKILIVGGGVAALEACLGLRWDASIEAEVTIVSEDDSFVFRPLAVLEPFGHGVAPRFSIEEIVDGATSEIIHGEISHFDLKHNRAEIKGGRTLDFDAAIIATGGERHSQLSNAVVIGEPGAMEQLSLVVAQLDAGLVPRIVFAMPQGACWGLPTYELAMFTAARAQHEMRNVDVQLLTPDKKPLIEFGKEASSYVVKLLGDAGVKLVRGCTATAYSDGILSTDLGESIETKYVVAAPEIRGALIEGLPHNDKGFLPVDEYGLVHGTSCIYAAGDITDFHIKQGGIASQQADVVVGAITEQFGGRAAVHPFEPELRGLLLSPRGHALMNAVVGDHDQSNDSLSTDTFHSLTEKIYSRHLTARLRVLMQAHASVR